MMWEGGNYWTTGNDVLIPSNNYVPAMVHDNIHVLLVDHDVDTLFNTGKQLEMFHYKVSCAEHANHGATFLGKLKIDVVMANINFPDPSGFKLLQHAVNMCIPVVWMSDDDNAMTVMRALENGAFLCIRRPPTIEFTRCLWQLVIQEKSRMMRDRDMLVVTSNNLGSVRGGVEFNDVLHHQNPNPNPNLAMMMRNKGGNVSKNSRGRKSDWYDGDEYDSDNTMMTNGRRNGNVKRKMCTEWTHELHAKFMDAVEQLGDGRCFPKEILELMNESGLTRMQVASHLQKCRNDNWRSPEDRKPVHQISQSSGGIPQSKPRTFGSKPQGILFPGHVHAKTYEMGQSSETQWETRAPNNDPKMGHASSDMTNNTSDQLGMSNSNPRHASDEFFNFPDMDCIMHEFSGGLQEPETNNLSLTREGYQVDPANDQNSGEASLKNKSP